MQKRKKKRNDQKRKKREREGCNRQHIQKKLEICRLQKIQTEKTEDDTRRSQVSSK